MFRGDVGTDALFRDQSRDRRIVYHRATAIVQHLRDFEFHRQKDAFYIHGKRLIDAPALFSGSRFPPTLPSADKTKV